MNTLLRAVGNEVLERGTSVERPRAMAAPGGGLTDVVDALVTEFAGGRCVRSGEDRYAGA
jgi:carboxylate-amine ligase